MSKVDEMMVVGDGIDGSHPEGGELMKVGE